MPRYQHKPDKLVIGGLQARNPSGATWCDRVDITSKAGNLHTITAHVVTASSVILTQTHRFLASSETVPFNAFAVVSINPGTGFSVGPVNSIAALVSSYQLSYVVINRG